MEAKLSIFADLDAPMDLAAEGLTLFKHGITDEERQEYRNHLFSVTIDSIKQVMNENLVGIAGRTVVIGEAKMDEWTKVSLENLQ